MKAAAMANTLDSVKRDRLLCYMKSINAVAAVLTQARGLAIRRGQRLLVKYVLNASLLKDIAKLFGTDRWENFDKSLVDKPDCQQIECQYILLQLLTAACAGSNKSDGIDLAMKEVYVGRRKNITAVC